MKKTISILCLALLMLLTGCSNGIQIVPIASLSPTQTTANVYSQEPQETDTPQTTTPVVVERLDESGMTVSSRINPPTGYSRIYGDEKSFAAFMRAYPLKNADAQVMQYDETPRADAKAAAILDTTLGKKNHEGPAGAMARLIAEYLYNQERYSDISFTIGSKFNFTFDKWRKGNKLKIKDSDIEWVSGGTDSNSEENFKSYLTNLFVYISTTTLDKDLKLVEDVDSEEIAVGDVFIGTNAEGKKSAIMVADICQSAETGEKLMLLVQGGSPAQQLHIVENPNDALISPWYPCAFGAELITPDVTVRIEDRYRFNKFITEE